MGDLIFLSLENWDDIWRRNQFFCAELVRRFPQSRMLFVGKPIFLPLFARHLKSEPGRQHVRETLKNRFWSVPQFPQISVFNPIKLLPNPLPGARASNEAYMTAQIRGAARRARIENPLLWINPYDMGFLAGNLNERGVVYDITDDWELMASTPIARARIAAQDRFLCARADLTVVCSQALFTAREPVSRQILLVPNGVDAAHYARIDSNDAQPAGFFDQNGGFHADSDADANADSPSESAPKTGGKSWPRPVFGYTGTLHRERVDLEMVTQLARAHPTGSVVLVGPQHWTDDSLQRALEAHPNLHAPGPVAYRDIPDVMARFDVCIVPHQQSGFVESLNPIKLWEYLACGKPIVSTDVAGFRDYPDLVRLAPDARGFIDACRAALQEVNGARAAKMAQQPQKWPLLPSRSAERRAAIAAHSWTARVDSLVERLVELNLMDAATP